jgi:hypothetical protein
MGDAKGVPVTDGQARAGVQSGENLDDRVRHKRERERERTEGTEKAERTKRTKRDQRKEPKDI